MLDPFQRSDDSFDIQPVQKLTATVAGLFEAAGESFVTRAVERLALTFDGIPGDVHAGPTRKSGAREPWYKRGTIMRNERQLSILSPQELRVVAQRLGIPELKCEWIGGNLLLDGIPSLTMLPPRTLLFFEGGATVKIDGDNAPCRVAGRSIAEHFPGRPDLDLAFSQQAQNLRGLVGWVEKEGVIEAGEAVQVRVPPQWIYRA